MINEVFPDTEQPAGPNLDSEDAAGGDLARGDGTVWEPEAHDDTAVNGLEISTHAEDVEPKKTVRTTYTPISS